MRSLGPGQPSLTQAGPDVSELRPYYEQQQCAAQGRRIGTPPLKASLHPQEASTQDMVAWLLTQVR